MNSTPQTGTPTARFSRGKSDHPLITVHAAAQALGYSDMTIRRKIESRQFPAVKIGSKALVPRAFVEQLMADALRGKTVVVEEYAAAWSKSHGGDKAPTSAALTDFAAVRASQAADELLSGTRADAGGAR